MTQQMGSTSGTAPASRDAEVTPGGASELTSESVTDTAPGGASGIAVADREQPASTGPASASDTSASEHRQHRYQQHQRRHRR